MCWRIVTEVLLIVGVHVQLSLLAIDLLLVEGGVSTLDPFKDPKLYQGTGTILEGVKEDEVQQSAVPKDIPEAYELRHEEADRASEFSIGEHQLVLKEKKIEIVTKAHVEYSHKMHSWQSH